jgi:hypothetical protein
VAMYHDAVHLSIRRSRSAQVDERSSVWRSKGYKYKGITQERTMALDRISIYAYTCIALVGSAIIGLIVFAWIAIRKFRVIPRR